MEIIGFIVIILEALYFVGILPDDYDSCSIPIFVLVIIAYLLFNNSSRLFLLIVATLIVIVLSKIYGNQDDDEKEDNYSEAGEQSNNNSNNNLNSSIDNGFNDYSNYNTTETIDNFTEKGNIEYEIKNIPNKINDAPVIQNEKQDTINNQIDVVDINTATLDQLRNIPAITIVKAKKIIQLRESGIYIKSFDDLAQKLNLKEYEVEQLKEYISITQIESTNNSRRLDL